MTLSIIPSVPQPTPGQPFDVTLVVDQPMSTSTPLTAEAELPNGTKMTETSTITIAGIYGPVVAPGYTVVQDATNPALFHLTPASA